MFDYRAVTLFPPRKQSKVPAESQEVKLQEEMQEFERRNAEYLRNVDSDSE